MHFKDLEEQEQTAPQIRREKITTKAGEEIAKLKFCKHFLLFWKLLLHFAECFPLQKFLILMQSDTKDQ